MIRRGLAVLVAIALGAAIGVGARRLFDDDDTRASRANATDTPRPTEAITVGRFEPDAFPLVRSVTVGRGWRLTRDSTALLEIARTSAPLGSVGFSRPTHVFEDRFLPAADAAGPAAKVTPLPDDLAAYFASIPEVRVFPSTVTRVDGMTATTFAVALRPLPADNRTVCDRSGNRCLFWGRRGTQLYALFENDVTAFTVVRIRRQTLVIAAAAPVRGGETFEPVVNQVVRTVKLRRG